MSDGSDDEEGLSVSDPVTFEIKVATRLRKMHSRWCDITNKVRVVVVVVVVVRHGRVAV